MHDDYWPADWQLARVNVDHEFLCSICQRELTLANVWFYTEQLDKDHEDLVLFCNEHRAGPPADPGTDTTQ